MELRYKPKSRGNIEMHSNYFWLLTVQYRKSDRNIRHRCHEAGKGSAGITLCIE